MDEFPDSDDEYDMVETHLYEAERSVAGNISSHSIMV